jgi:hypothetical protein
MNESSNQSAPRGARSCVAELVFTAGSAGLPAWQF